MGFYNACSSEVLIFFFFFGGGGGVWGLCLGLTTI